MTEASASTTSIERVPTGVAGLDAVLGGGLLRGGVFLVMGSPGAGKTVLSNQICFVHARDASCAVYVTLLAESHSRMLSHIERMDFYEPSLVAKSVFYLSGYSALEEKKLEGLLDLVRREARQRRAKLIVIDGLVTVGAAAEAELTLKKFVHELKAFTEMNGCICVITTSSTDNPSGHYPVRTMVDGLIELRLSSMGMRTARELEVVKLRGSRQLMGVHLFEISSAGIKVFPRVEAIYGRSPARELPRDRRRLGVEGLDRMLGGGVLAGSATTVLGPPGSGKTLLGLEFLKEGARQDEVGLYFGFFETPPRLIDKAEGVGLALRREVREGKVDLQWLAPLEQHADAVIQRLLGLVEERGATRLVIDGIAGIAQGVLHHERLEQVVIALTNELRARAVTTLVTEESGLEPTGGQRVPFGRFSAAADNIIVLRYRERLGALRRYVSILKMREGRYDASMRQFSITERGFTVDGGRRRTDLLRGVGGGG